MKEDKRVLQMKDKNNLSELQLKISGDVRL